MDTNHTRRFLYLSSLIMDMCIGMVLFAVPLFLIKRLQASVFVIGLTGSLGALGYSIFCLGTGRLSDRLGRKKVAIMGIGIFVSTYFLITFVRTLFPVFILVFLGGIGMSMFWPPVQAWVAESTEKKRLIESLGVFNISWSMGLMLGPLLGGMLFPLGTSIPFYFAVGQAAILSFVILQLSEPQKKPLLCEPEVWSEKGIVNKASFLFIAWMANFVSWFIVIMLRNLFPVLAVTLEMSPRMLGFLIFLVYISQTAMFLLLRHLRGWHYRMEPLLLCQGLAAGGLIIGFFTSSVLLFGISFVLIGVSGGMTYFSSIFYSLDSSPATKGKKTGFHESILGTGGLLGPLFGGLVARYYDLRAPYLLGLTLIICAMLMEVVIYRNAR